MIRCYTQPPRGQRWLQRFRNQRPLFVCVLGFTATGLIPQISAAGATPDDRRYTALADAEFLWYGAQHHPRYPLPPLQAGASPVLITRAVVSEQQIPVRLFNAGLPDPLPTPAVDLGGQAARCLSHGDALDWDVVQHLLQQGLHWGEILAAEVPSSYLILSECVVGGTTTALAVLLGLGWNAMGKVNSSHPSCNHQQKAEVVQEGLRQWAARLGSLSSKPLDVVAAVGDPMQPVVAGMAIAASRRCGVLLAGGTQMLAVYALAEAIAHTETLPWHPEQVMVGTTRWVAEDATGDTVGLAELVQAPLIATQLNFTQARYQQLQAYERGYVKEGVGAGGAAIAAHLYRGWGQLELLSAVEQVADQLQTTRQNNPNLGA
ncbi:MAG: TIGR00303 family protein [Synechococcales cyanobacterium M58_A2018_015]|nr:TIGR00303 family protein [Synechococcales cyanobacterium M58_A2018_015]